MNYCFIEPPIYTLMAFVFFATICSYSFHWYLTPDLTIDSSRIKWLSKNRNVHLVLFFAGTYRCGNFRFFTYSHWPLVIAIRICYFSVFSS